MSIQITKTEYSRMPHSINNHIMKSFMLFGVSFWMDKTTDCFPQSYDLYETGNGRILSDFCQGESWKSALKFVEGYLTAKCE